MKKGAFLAVLMALSFVGTGPASAHFGMVIPSDQKVIQGEDTKIKEDLMFWHPFECHGIMR